MLYLYNIIQLLLLLFLSPLLLLLGLSAKYRQRIPARFGIGLRGAIGTLPERPRVWIHALSVGEAASCKPLLQEIRQRRPDVYIVFSTTTTGGTHYARQMSDLIDLYVPFPFDLIWVVAMFINLVKPDLFILTETDLWPNFLWHLARKKIPSMLINGRITQKSFSRYQAAKFLFAPVFNTFSTVSMQMEEDAARMKALGVERHKVVPCGNLKYDLSLTLQGLMEQREKLNLPVPAGAIVVVAGSTHPGEEEILLRVYKDLLARQPHLFLIIAPRDVSRGREVLALVQHFGMRGSLRSSSDESVGSVIVLDTLGELAAVYGGADVAFVGGSLVPEGGHNPLEPAVFGKPVIFGPYMEDFAEIAHNLIEVDGAMSVSAGSLFEILEQLTAEPERRNAMGRNSAALLNRHQGAASRYMTLVEEYLPHAG